MKEKVLLFIPCYNCEKQIIRVLEQLKGEILEYISEVVIVNNRSIDRTEKIVLEYLSKTPYLKAKLLRNRENYGLGGSHKVAFKYAIKNDFDYIIVLHGDDQGSISDFHFVFKTQLYKDYDCILGSRFMKNSKLKGYSKFRTFGNYVYNFIFSIFLGQRIEDLGSGLNMYDVSILKSQFYKKFSDSLMYNCYMLLANRYYKFRIKFVPISWREEDQVSNVKLFNQAISTLMIPLKYAFTVNKKKYMLSDHRTLKISSYDADIIFEQGGAEI